MSLRLKFWAAFGVIAVLAICLALYGVRVLSTTGDLVVRLYDEPLIGVNYARAASASLSEARGLMSRALFTDPDKSTDIAASLQRTERDIAEDLAIVRARMPDSDVTTALDRAESSVAAWFRSARMFLVATPDGVTELPTPALLDRQTATAMAQVDDLVEHVAAIGFAFRSRAETEMHASRITMVCLSGGIIAISVLFALLSAQLLIRPVRAATRIAEDVADGTFDTVITTRRRDEIGCLLRSLAAMQVNLRSREKQALVLMQEKDQAAAALRQINLRFEAALDNMPHGLLMCDAGSHVAVINRRFCDLYGISSYGLRPGAAYRDVIVLSVAAGNHPGRTVDEVLADCTPTLEPRPQAAGVLTIAEGRTVAISHEPMPDGGWVAIHEDITDRRRSEEQIVFLARHDALTQLPNRVLFQERLNQALAQAERGKGFALLFLDLDRFKIINDTLGHPIGDRLLCAVAGRLRDMVRESDTVARLGGDEFAILQLGVSAPADATVLARRVAQAIRQPYDLEGHGIDIGVSIGITLAPGDGIHSVQLLKNADLALYRAKENGRGCWHFFEPAMDALASARRAVELELRDATLLDQLELHYQPVVCSRGRTVTGFEALLRWRHPTRGMVPPAEFISVTEEIGLIVPIGAWVLNQACAEAAAWPNHLRVAVNLSPRQFRGQALVGTVADALRTSGLRPERLELEITESVLLQDDPATVSTLRALQAMGIRIALDDFGTGYSSLSYLLRFPFDTIKIDRSFVRELPTREDCATIVRAITGLGHSLHMHTTAEGVETEAQFEFLAAAGCTEIQGYLFSKPVTACAVPALIAVLSAQPGSAALAGAAD